MDRRRWVRYKYVVDRCVSALLIFICWPVAVLVVAAIVLQDGRPILFKQRRIGQGGSSFTLYKFRSMQVPVHRVDPESDSRRVTRLGRILRRYSLDEIPQLLNILRGDMSFIGPRPLPVEYRPWFTPAETERHRVRPGITGLAQVTGRNTAAWDERLALDVQYVRSMTFGHDVALLAATVTVLITRRGMQEIPSEHGARRLDVYRSFPGKRGYKLRLLTQDDLGSRVVWLGDPVVRANMNLTGHIDYGSTTLWFNNHHNSPIKHDLVMQHEDGTVVGMCGFSDEQPGSATLYFLIGGDYRGKGLGHLITELALEWAFTHRGYSQVLTSVWPWNEASLRIHRGLGFREAEATGTGRIQFVIEATEYRRDL